MLFAVRHLIDGRQKPLTILSSDGIQEVLSLMTENEFSQIPVVDAKECPLGLVTMKSILKAAHSLDCKITDLDVRVAMEKVTTIRLDDDMHELLNETKRKDAVLITDGEGRLVGILTHFDTTHFFRKRIEDMLLVEDIETMLKKLIQSLYSKSAGEKGTLPETIESVTSPARQLKPKFEAAIKMYLSKAGLQVHQLVSEHVNSAFQRLDISGRAKSFEELTLSDYSEILTLHLNCPKVGPTTDKTALRRLLNDVREIRNKLLHFRGEVTTSEREQLRLCKKWFERVGGVEGV